MESCCPEVPVRVTVRPLCSAGLSQPVPDTHAQSQDRKPHSRPLPGPHLPRPLSEHAWSLTNPIFYFGFLSVLLPFGDRNSLTCVLT